MIRPNAYQPPICLEHQFQWQPMCTELQPYLTGCWQLELKQGTFEYLALPDACQYLVFVEYPGGHSCELCLPKQFPYQRTISGPIRIFCIGFAMGMRQLFFPNRLSQYHAIQDSAALHQENMQPVLAFFRENPQFEARQKCMEQWLKQQISLKIALSSTLKRAIQASAQLLNHPKTELTESWAQTLGVSLRQLRRDFDTHIGLSPKQFSDYARFQWSMQKLLQHGESWLYRNHPYYDESHLIRHFQKFTGTTPKQILAKHAVTKIES
ncbi:hypothetical protein VST7929_02214 [Vibrio stylophorae]|uniref:HTH araC/xylS-type domain-containing protein n=1 Tax=Vibrio stylophorae TaxID=659351 RepID=A0ABM8ZVR2_9VIBR|nr:AraC family transcriptional regulator [Vibrio stylophorae]CAH0534298.1 hypothetical protein VST7929_02214 [Vibrio stylophorae]